MKKTVKRCSLLLLILFLFVLPSMGGSKTVPKQTPDAIQSKNLGYRLQILLLDFGYSFYFNGNVFCDLVLNDIINNDYFLLSVHNDDEHFAMTVMLSQNYDRMLAMVRSKSNKYWYDENLQIGENTFFAFQNPEKLENEELCFIRKQDGKYHEMYCFASYRLEPSKNLNIHNLAVNTLKSMTKLTPNSSPFQHINLTKAKVSFDLSRDFSVITYAEDVTLNDFLFYAYNPKSNTLIDLSAPSAEKIRWLMEYTKSEPEVYSYEGNMKIGKDNYFVYSSLFTPKTIKDKVFIRTAKNNRGICLLLESNIDTNNFFNIAEQLLPTIKFN